jgi:hypothetical protein
LVSTIHTGVRVNGVNGTEALEEAARFAASSDLLLKHIAPEVRERTGYYLDPSEPVTIDRTSVAAALRHVPGGEEKLQLAGTKRGGDPIAYVAAHLQMHDTDAILTPNTPNTPDPIAPERIVSLGAQSERIFYLARMACRQGGVAIPNTVEGTAQLFTRHILPPYFECRDGNEPTLQDLELALSAENVYRRRLEVSDDFYSLHQTPSVARDIAYVLTSIGGTSHA